VPLAKPSRSLHQVQQTNPPAVAVSKFYRQRFFPKRTHRMKIQHAITQVISMNNSINHLTLQYPLYQAPNPKPIEIYGPRPQCQRGVHHLNHHPIRSHRNPYVTLCCFIFHPENGGLTPADRSAGKTCESPRKKRILPFANHTRQG